MRVVNTAIIKNCIAEMVVDACYCLDDSLIEAFETAKGKEESPVGREVLTTISDNARMAKNEKIPCCQDTGIVVVFLNIGQEVFLEGDNVTEAINEGVREGYQKGFLRFSVLNAPLQRINTGDNTPAIIHTKIVPGDKISLTVMPKGGGSENMGRLALLTPAAGREDIKRIVLETVEAAGGKACPPLFIGVGIGGTMEKCAILAKEALTRKIGERNREADLASLEKECLELVNKTGIGPLGFGGRCTALDLFIESYACHITAFPVAVNLQCHSDRIRKQII